MKILQNLKFKLEQADDWSVRQIKSAINSVSSEMGLKLSRSHRPQVGSHRKGNFAIH